jgi:hypothetical protein
VEEPVLLRQVGPEGHSDLDLAGGYAREPCADGSHKLLSGEAIAHPSSFS